MLSGGGASAVLRSPCRALRALIGARTDLDGGLRDSEAQPQPPIDESSSSTEFDKRQVRLTFEVGNAKLQTLPFSDLRSNAHARRLSSLHPKTRSLRVLRFSEEPLLGCPPVEALVRRNEHVPGYIGIEFGLKGWKRHREGQFAKHSSLSERKKRSMMAMLPC